MKKFKASTIALWVLGLLFAWAVYTVGHYYTYITPPSNLRINPNECFSKSTQNQIEEMVNSNLALKAYNSLSTNGQENTTVKTIQNSMSTRLSAVVVNDVNHDTGKVVCGATYQVKIKSPDGSKVMAKSQTNNIFYLQGTKNGIEFQFPAHVITSLFNNISRTSN